LKVGLRDFPQYFVNFVERVAVVENLTNALRIQVASRRFKTALDWPVESARQMNGLQQSQAIAEA
jgi:hypothetical protein